MTKAYILNGNDNIPRDRDMLDLYQGALENCCEVVFYQASDVICDRIKITKDDIFCGTINLCRKVFNDFGIKEPKIEDYPPQLKEYLKRNIRKMQLYQFKNMLLENEQNGVIQSYFIKPIKTKYFTGRCFTFLHDFAAFPDLANSDFGIKEPKIEDYPPQLKEYLKRNIRKMQLYQFKNMLLENEQNGVIQSYFIKPIKTKYFTGRCFTFLHDFAAFPDLANSTEIYISSVVKFASEYRVYIHNNKILDMYRYDGDWRIFPNTEVICKMFECINTVMPISYSIDVGIVDDTRDTLLVECNDGYALGNYGVAPKEYFDMIRDRWFQIVKG